MDSTSTQQMPEVPRSQGAPAQLEEGIYLDSEHLKAGDVLLTRGPGKESRAITFFTGPFSHVALFTSSSSLAEAFDDGVGYTSLESVGVTVNGEEQTWICLPRPAEDAIVLRHPRLEEQLSEADAGAALAFRDRIDRIVGEMCGLPYSYLHRLAVASSQPEPVQKVLTYLLNWKEDRILKSPLKGLFCSEFVAEVFRKLDLPLFDDQRPSDRVNPSALASESALQQVPEAVVPSEWVTQADIVFQFPRLVDPRSHLPLIVDMREVGAMLVSLARRSEKLVRGVLMQELGLLYGALDTDWHELIAKGDREGAFRASALMDDLLLDAPSIAKFEDNRDACADEDIVRVAGFQRRAYAISRFRIVSRLKATRKQRHARRWTPWCLSPLERHRRHALRLLRDAQRSMNYAVKGINECYSGAQRARLVANTAYIDIRLPSASPDGRTMEDVRTSEEEAVMSDEVSTAAGRIARERKCLQAAENPAWWRDHLRVSFPEDPFTMRVEVSGGLPDEVLALVEALVDAYLQEVVARWKASVDQDAESKRFAKEFVTKVMNELKRLVDAQVVSPERILPGPAEENGSAILAGSAHVPGRAETTNRNNSTENESEPTAVYQLPAKVGPATFYVRTLGRGYDRDRL